MRARVGEKERIPWCVGSGERAGGEKDESEKAKSGDLRSVVRLTPLRLFNDAVGFFRVTCVAECAATEGRHKTEAQNVSFGSARIILVFTVSYLGWAKKKEEKKARRYRVVRLFENRLPVLGAHVSPIVLRQVSSSETALCVFNCFFLSRQEKNSSLTTVTVELGQMETRTHNGNTILRRSLSR